jgi:hypothetical protein
MKAFLSTTSSGSEFIEIQYHSPFSGQPRTIVLAYDKDENGDNVFVLNNEVLGDLLDIMNDC